jgi:hypothetical protein
MDHQFRTEKLQLKHGVHPTQVQLQQQGLKPRLGQQDEGRLARPAQELEGHGSKRKKKVVKPRSRARTFLKTLAWAENAQDQASTLASPAYLQDPRQEDAPRADRRRGRDLRGLQVLRPLLSSTPADRGGRGGRSAAGSAGKLEAARQRRRAPEGDRGRARTRRRTASEPPLEVLRRLPGGRSATCGVSPGQSRRRRETAV